MLLKIGSSDTATEGSLHVHYANAFSVLRDFLHCSDSSMPTETFLQRRIPDNKVKMFSASYNFIFNNFQWHDFAGMEFKKWIREYSKSVDVMSCTRRHKKRVACDDGIERNDNRSQQKKQALMGRLNKMCNIFAAALQPIIAVATKHSLPCWDKRRIVA